jgi:hypothetical protein
MPVKAPLARLLQDNATFLEAVKAFGKNLSTAKKHEMYPFLSLIEEARKKMDERQPDSATNKSIKYRLLYLIVW